MTTVIYDVLLKRYPGCQPFTGYLGEPKYICVYYDEDRNKALKEMAKYVKAHGFTTPDERFAIADVVLREREATGEFISEVSYCELFDTITGKLKKTLITSPARL